MGFYLTLISFDSSELWAQIPDCGSCFGLWPRQRCSQNRDCYQNQRQDTVLNVFAPKKKKYFFKSVLGTETPLYRWVAGICESASWLKLFLTMLGTPPSLCLGAGRALLQLLATVRLPFSRPPFCNNEECVERCLFTNEVMREKVPCDCVMCRSKKTLLADTLLFMLSY